MKPPLGAPFSCADFRRFPCGSMTSQRLFSAAETPIRNTKHAKKESVARATAQIAEVEYFDFENTYVCSITFCTARSDGLLRDA